MGHGNSFSATHRVYKELVWQLRRDYPDILTVMSLVEGSPSIDTIIKELKAENVQTILLKPFMIVAGDHVRKDMIGDRPDSLKAKLEAEGFSVVPVMDGLGENTEFADIFVQHTIDAAQDAGIELT